MLYRVFACSHGLTLTYIVAQISSEERSYAGAPQGDIFEAKVLETSELPVSSDVAKSLEVSVRRSTFGGAARFVLDLCDS